MYEYSLNFGKWAVGTLFRKGSFQKLFSQKQNQNKQAAGKRHGQEK